MTTELSEQIMTAHDEAVKRGEGGYFDPHSGLFVMTALQLKIRGHCCGQGCRHCPYSAQEQYRAGRPGVPKPAANG